MPQSPLASYPSRNPANSAAPLRTATSGALFTAEDALGDAAALKLNSAGALVVAADNPTVAVSVSQALGTIGVTGTFQSAMAANAARLVGGSISNHGAAFMLVAFGTTAAGRGIQVIPGGTLFLADVFPNEPYTGAISITGTATQTFTTTEVSAA